MIDLKRFRKDKNLTQIELGKILGLSGSAIAKAEAGDFDIPQRWVDDLRKKYNDISQYLTEENLRRGSKVPLYSASTNYGNEQLVDFGDLLPGTELAYIVSGDMMGSLHPSGSLLGLRKINSLEFEYGNLYILKTKDNIFFRRVYKGSKDISVILLADNTDKIKEGVMRGTDKYQPIEIMKEDILEVYTLTGSIIPSNANLIK